METYLILYQWKMFDYRHGRNKDITSMHKSESLPDSRSRRRMNSRVLPLIGLLFVLCHSHGSSTAFTTVPCLKMKQFSNGSIQYQRNQHKLLTQSSDAAEAASTLDVSPTATPVESEVLSDGMLMDQSFQERYGAVLPEWLLDKCQELGWDYPTRIQQQVLDSVLMDGITDSIVQAETGTVARNRLRVLGLCARDDV